MVTLFIGLRKVITMTIVISLSTTWGYADTSVSPIFMAAGPGLKVDFETERIIRQVDVVPTIATILGVRMPHQCEGAPIYQILEQEF